MFVGWDLLTSPWRGEAVLWRLDGWPEHPWRNTALTPVEVSKGKIICPPVLHNECKSLRGPFNMNKFGSRLQTVWHDLSLTSDLEVVPNIHHAALHKGLSGLLLQRRPSHIQRMDISKVINAADVHPVPGADLDTKTSGHIEFCCQSGTHCACCRKARVRKRHKPWGPPFSVRLS